MSQTAECVAHIHARAPAEPVSAAIILGTGLGPLADDIAGPSIFDYGELPGFPLSGVTGHESRLVIGELAGRRVALFQGREHYYEHGNADAMRTPIEVADALGASSLVVTNSAGSLDPDCGPGSVMMITDHISFSGRNPLIGEPGDERFVDLSQAYDLGLQEQFRQAAAATEIGLAEGTYIWFSGPSFETPAEIRAARILGADAVGMSTVPEVIIARRIGLRVAALSLIVNAAAGMGPPLDHSETKRIATEGVPRLRRLITEFTRNLGDETAD